jgi:hypothetical protein
MPHLTTEHIIGYNLLIGFMTILLHLKSLPKRNSVKLAHY